MRDTLAQRITGDNRSCSASRPFLWLVIAAIVGLLLSACPVPSGPETSSGPETPEPTKYSVIYDANGASEGTAPTDDRAYLEGEYVTVLDNTGGLARNGALFSGWNTQSNGGGTQLLPGDTFAMGTADATLYASWGSPISFSAVGAVAAGQWNSVTYGGGVFVAISRSGQVMTSPDGITWTVRSAPEANQWEDVTYGNGLFVVVAVSGEHRVMTSPDGITWTARSAATQMEWGHVAFGNGVFVAAAGTKAMWSPDGITWTASHAVYSMTNLTFGNGLFVASSNYPYMQTSPDGNTWTLRDVSGVYWSLGFGDGLFVAFGQSSDWSWQVTTSDDAITWSAPRLVDQQAWSSVTYGGGLFVAVSDYGSPIVMTSPDGITWTSGPAIGPNGWDSVTYGNGEFVAVCDSGPDYVMYAIWAP